MKKFLSVLLALAVAFTFTFGSCMSAFAADPTYTAAEVVQAMVTEANDCADLFAGQGTTYMKNLASYKDLTGTDAPTVKATKAATAAVVNDVVAAKKAAFLKKAAEIEATVTAASYTEDQKATEVQKITTEYTTNYTIDFDAATTTALLAKKQIGLVKADALTTLGKYDASKYNTSTKAEDLVTVAASDISGLTAGEKVAKNVYVQAVIDNAKKLVNDTEVVDAEATNVDNIKAIAARLTAVDTMLETTIPTIEEENATSKTLAEEKTYQISLAKGQVATAEAQIRKGLNDKLTALKAATPVDAAAVSAVETQIAALAGQVAATEEVINAQINAQTKKSTLDTLVSTGNVHTIIAGLAWTDYASYEAGAEATLKANDTKSKAVVELNDLAKLMTNSGSYDDKDLADKLAAAIADVYTGAKDLAAAKTYLGTAAKKATASLAQKSAAIKNVTAAAGATDPWTAVNDTNYDEAQKAEAQTIVDATVAKINAAATNEEIIELVAAAKKEFDKVVTKSAHGNDWLATGTLGKEFGKTYQTELASYSTYALANLNDTTYSKAKAALGITDAVYTNIPKVVMDKVKEAYTVAEIAGKVAEAKAILNGLKSNAELETAAKTVEDAINAIKVPVTLADKDAVVAAIKAMDAYKKNQGATASDVSNNALLGTVTSTMKGLVTADLTNQYNALVAKKITVADAKTIEDLKAAIAEYKATFSDSVYTKDFTAIDRALSTAKVNDAITKLAAVPTTVTLEDKATVEAARAAYDALSLEEQISLLATDLYKTYFNRLEAAELQIAEAVANEEAKAQLKKDLAIAKVTTKVTGKKIKVTAKKNAKAEYYQFKYKKGTGKYKAAKKALTNTKTFKVTKKGKYTVAVRAVVVMDDGSKVYGAWKTKKVTVK